MKYKFIKGWKRWEQGDVIREYEYKRIPVTLRHLLEPVEETPMPRIYEEPKITSIEIPAIEKSQIEPELPIEHVDKVVPTKPKKKINF